MMQSKLTKSHEVIQASVRSLGCQLMLEDAEPSEQSSKLATWSSHGLHGLLCYAPLVNLPRSSFPFKAITILIRLQAYRIEF